jgi:hypothetical protein
MQDYELDAWLGDTEATEEQRAALHAAADTIAARYRYPDPDLADTREQALSAAAMMILGDATLEEMAAGWRDAHRVERERHAALTGALIAAGGSEAALARRAGLTRVTVRKALGKR